MVQKGEICSDRWFLCSPTGSCVLTRMCVFRPGEGPSYPFVAKQIVSVVCSHLPPLFAGVELMRFRYYSRGSYSMYAHVRGG